MRESGFESLLSSETPISVEKGTINGGTNTVEILGEPTDEQKKLDKLSQQHISTLSNATFNAADKTIAINDGTVYKPMELNPAGPDQYYSFDTHGNITFQTYDGNGQEITREVKYVGGDSFSATYTEGQRSGIDNYEETEDGYAAHSDYQGEMVMKENTLVREGKGTYTNAYLQRFYGTWEDWKLNINGHLLTKDMLDQSSIGNMINVNGQDQENPEFANKVAELQESQRIENLKKEYMGDPLGFSIDESASMFKDNLAFLKKDQNVLFLDNTFNGSEQDYKNALYNGILLKWGTDDSGKYQRSILTINQSLEVFSGKYNEDGLDFHDVPNKLLYQTNPERRTAQVEKDGQKYYLDFAPQRDTINGTSVFLGFNVSASKVDSV